MKIFLDTEFLEGTQGTLFGKTKPTIDLISIGLVAEDNSTYYAISKDFNLKEAWNRYDVTTTQVFGDARNIYPEGIKKKVYWIRDNVLEPIYNELLIKDRDIKFKKQVIEQNKPFAVVKDYKFSYKNLKWLIKKYGKTNKQIAGEIQKFIFPKYADYDGANKLNYSPNKIVLKDGYWLDVEHLNPQFYAYYADYDWVVFCWLFGKMNELPNGFPMYCNDLKQISDEVYIQKKKEVLNEVHKTGMKLCFLNSLSEHLSYPKQTNEHHSLSDALWTKELYNFLNNL